MLKAMLNTYDNQDGKSLLKGKWKTCAGTKQLVASVP